MFALMLTASLAVPAKAAKLTWEFNKPVSGSYTKLAAGGKADAEKNWYITTNKTKYTNVSSANVFECKVTDSTGKRICKVQNITTYVTSKKVPYDSSVTVYKGFKSTLYGKKATTSTASGNLVLWGYFTP